jgi:hypothetical protein
VAAIANDPDFHLRLKLQPGDIEIIHNPSTFHSRTKVVDGEVRLATLVILLWGMNLAHVPECVQHTVDRALSFVSYAHNAFATVKSELC